MIIEGKRLDIYRFSRNDIYDAQAALDKRTSGQKGIYQIYPQFRQLRREICALEFLLLRASVAPVN
jgi:hypothetical protein